jgi:ribosomal protein L33
MKYTLLCTSAAEEEYVTSRRTMVDKIKKIKKTLL